MSSREKNDESDTTIKIAKIVLPLLVYIPITIFVVILGFFFGVKIYKYIINQFCFWTIKV